VLIFVTCAQAVFSVIDQTGFEMTKKKLSHVVRISAR